MFFNWPSANRMAKPNLIKLWQPKLHYIYSGHSAQLSYLWGEDESKK